MLLPRYFTLMNLFSNLYAINSALLDSINNLLPSNIFFSLMIVVIWYESVRILALVYRPNTSVFFYPSWSIFVMFYKFASKCLTLLVRFICLWNWKLHNTFWTSYDELLFYRSRLLVRLSNLTTLLKLDSLSNSILRQKQLALTATITLLGCIRGVDQTYLYVKFMLLLPITFLKIALLPIHVTWVLVLFYYKVFLDLDLYPVKKVWPTLRETVIYLYSYCEAYYATYFSTNPGPSLIKQVFVTNLLADLIFLKQYYRLNDLIWQDGMLIDFLQKKVADRWVRTFVIYSGYLFNERFVFDFVVRFYIDYVIWPTYRVSIYEFNSVSSTLTMTLFLLIVLFFFFSLHFLSFFLL